MRNFENLRILWFNSLINYKHLSQMPQNVHNFLSFAKFLNYVRMQISDQFKSAKLDRSKATHWSEIYDFTPNDVTPNWKRYERGKHTPEKYICLPQPVNFYADLEIRLEDETTLVQANVILQD